MPKVTEDQLAARRGAILDAARRAFARHGYEGATVKVLEAETGLHLRCGLHVPGHPSPLDFHLHQHGHILRSLKKCR